MRPLRLTLTIVITLFTLVLAASAGALIAVMYFNAPPETPPQSTASIKVEDDDGPAAVIEVYGGEGAASVGARLEEAGIIRSRLFWYALFRLDAFLRPERFLKQGVYRLRLPASQTGIRDQLEAGQEILIRVTVPEGYTIKKMAALFEESGICAAADFIAAAERRGPPRVSDTNVSGTPAGMEGYLYPDTYLFPAAYPAEKVVQTVSDTFWRRLAEFGIDTAQLSDAEINKRVIIASIVEREYRVAEEAPLMAGVFYKRLEINMPLESCATVEYIITEIEGRPHPERIYTRDTRIQNPYNTYIHRGLPPGPISAPGETALRAAFSPERSGYLFFRIVDAEAGRHYFSATFDEHIRAGTLLVKR
jgi:UPF0755 protein